MDVVFLFFGATAAVIGERQIQISLPEGATSNKAFDEIKKRFPRLNDHKLHLAINEKYAKGDEIVCDGDKIAIFTAVSGG